MHGDYEGRCCCTFKSVSMSVVLLPLPYFQAAKLQRHPITDLCGILVHIVTSYLWFSMHKYISTNSKRHVGDFCNYICSKTGNLSRGTGENPHRHRKYKDCRQGRYTGIQIHNLHAEADICKHKIVIKYSSVTRC